MREFDERASKRIWSAQILRNKQNKVIQRIERSLCRSAHQLKENQNYALQCLEYLDHQVFFGSRITNRWHFPEDRSYENLLSNQIDKLMKNIWPSQTPRQMHLELLQRPKNAALKARQNIMTDIDQQLRLKAANS